MLLAALVSQIVVLNCEGVGVSEQEASYTTTSLTSAVATGVKGQYKVMDSDTIANMMGPEGQKCFAGLCPAAIAKKLQASYAVKCVTNKADDKILTSIEVYSSAGDYVLGYQPSANDAMNIAKEISDKFPNLISTKLIDHNKPKIKRPEYTSEEIEKAARWLDTQKAAVEADTERVAIERASNDRTAKWAEYDKAVAKRISAEADFKKATAERIAAEKALENWNNAEKGAAKRVDAEAESEKLAKLAASEADAKWAAAKRVAAEKAAAKWAAAEKAAAEKAGMQPPAKPIAIQKIGGKEDTDEPIGVTTIGDLYRQVAAENTKLAIQADAAFAELDAAIERVAAEADAAERAAELAKAEKVKAAEKKAMAEQIAAAYNQVADHITKYSAWCGKEEQYLRRAWDSKYSYSWDSTDSSFFYNVHVKSDAYGRIYHVALVAKDSSFSKEACRFGYWY